MKNMNTLADLVTIEENNETCVIMKVKTTPKAKLALIALGCFNGNETLIRLTKGNDHTCTVWHGDNGNVVSWHWGISGFTLVTDNTRNLGHMVLDCLTTDFEIYMGADPSRIAQTLHTKKPRHAKHLYEMMWFGNVRDCEDTYCSTHLDHEFAKQYTEPELRKMLADNGYKIVRENLTTSPNTGCWIKQFYVEK